MPGIQEATHQYESWLGAQLDIVPEDIDLKHRKMSEGRFQFLRATFYRWAEAWPDRAREWNDAPTVLAVGDIHVENFGTWRDADARLVWGVNDFDEVHPMPYTSDLVRLTASAMLADEEDQLAVNARIICEQVLQGYRQCLASGGAPFVLEENHHWLREIAYAEFRSPEQFWDRMKGLPVLRGKIPTGASRLLGKSLPSANLPYRIVLRSAGLGSLGRPRYTAIADWLGSQVAREAKARAASSCLWSRKTAGRNQDDAAKLLDSAVRAPDPTLQIAGRWTVRRLAPHCSKIEIGALPKQRDEERLLYAMGWELGNMHLGTPAAVRSIRLDLDRRPSNWLRDAAKAMLRGLDADYHEWTKRPLPRRTASGRRSR